jgi:hypothetical protein
MKEYRVVLDESQTMKNKPEALEKILNDMTADGWTLEKVTTASAQNVSRIYFIFSRQK